MNILDNPSSLSNNITDFIGFTGTTLGILAVIGSIAVLRGTQFFTRSREDEHIEGIDEDPEERLIKQRLAEARTAVKAQDATAARNRIASTLLTFGQTVIGGVLATSFVQESLSRAIVGTLGVLVLLSSLIHQRYRPDLKTDDARERSYRLRVLIRAVENDLAAVEAHRAAAPSLEKILKKLTAGINEVERLDTKSPSGVSKVLKSVSPKTDVLSEEE
jgi:hypothetical protein